MSAAAHERMGQQEDLAAQQHARQYDPGARERQTTCPASEKGLVCWTSVRNPTAEHLQTAEKHRKRAAEHRAASAALRDAEVRACAGVMPQDRDTSPFEHPEDIVSVEPLEQQTIAKEPLYRTAGAEITFRAVPGMTVEGLQRIVDCHLARNAALGHIAPDMPDCPLVPRGVMASVGTTDGGFVVAVSSEEPDVVQEVLERAHRLQRATPTR